MAKQASRGHVVFSDCQHTTAAVAQARAVYIDSVNAASQFKLLCQEFPRLLESVFGDSTLQQKQSGVAFTLHVQHWVLPSIVHVHYVLLIELVCSWEHWAYTVKPRIPENKFVRTDRKKTLAQRKCRGV